MEVSNLDPDHPTERRGHLRVSPPAALRSSVSRQATVGALRYEFGRVTRTGEQEGQERLRLIDDAERRARMARRRAFAPQPRVADAQTATRAMTVLHATEPATPYLSLFARIDSFTRADLEHALFEAKSLVKQLPMRRTLFVFPRDLLPAAVSSPSARVAHQEAGKLVKDLERSQVTDDGASWLATAREAVLRRLASGAGLGGKELREGLVERAGQGGG